MFNQHLKVFGIETFSSKSNGDSTNRQTNRDSTNSQPNRQTIKQTNNQSDRDLGPTNQKQYLVTKEKLRFFHPASQYKKNVQGSRYQYQQCKCCKPVNRCVPHSTRENAFQHFTQGWRKLQKRIKFPELSPTHQILVFS